MESWWYNKIGGQNCLLKLKFGQNSWPMINLSQVYNPNSDLILIKTWWFSYKKSKIDGDFFFFVNIPYVYIYIYIVSLSSLYMLLKIILSILCL